MATFDPTLQRGGTGGRDELSESQAEDARNDLLRLNEQVTASLLNLDMTVAAEVQLASTLRNENLLPANTAASLRSLASSLRDEILVPLERLFGGRLPDTPNWEQFDSLAARSDQLLNEAKLIEETEAAPTDYRAMLYLNSDPRGARIFWNGEQLGRTPFEGEIISADPIINLALRRRRHETSRISVSLLEGGEIREFVRLEPENQHPFGHTDRIGD